jgi:integrase
MSEKPNTKRATSGRGKLVKVRGIENLYQYSTTGIFYACYFRAGKTIKRSLETKDRQTAKQALAEVLRDSAKVDQGPGKATTLEELLELHMTVRVTLLDGATQAKIEYIKRTFLNTWQGSMTQKIRDVRRSDIERWLGLHRNRICASGKKLSKRTVNEYIHFLRAMFQTGMNDQLLVKSPMEGIKDLKWDKPVRRTPTVQEFRMMVADLRGQVYNAKSKDTADFVEFLGLAGLGNGEAAALRWGDFRFVYTSDRTVDWTETRIHIMRQKTDRGFVIPVYPQLVPLMESLYGLAAPDPLANVFKIASARRALNSCCERLGLQRYGHRSLRRMFIENCIHQGIDVQTIALWQGHNDGGQLILSTYAHVRQEFSDGQAAKLTAV